MLGTHGTLHELVGAARPDHLLAPDPKLDVVGEAGSVAEAMARIPAASPDVAVLDVRLPRGNGLELCRDLLSRIPDLRCLILTSYASNEAMLDAILAGKNGGRPSPAMLLTTTGNGLQCHTALAAGGCGDWPVEAHAASVVSTSWHGHVLARPASLVDHPRRLTVSVVVLTRWHAGTDKRTGSSQSSSPTKADEPIEISIDTDDNLADPPPRRTCLRRLRLSARCRLVPIPSYRVHPDNAKKNSQHPHSRGVDDFLRRGR